VVLDAEGGRRVALRVVVDDQNPQTGLGQGGGEVDRGRRLADAALLIRDRDDPRVLRAREPAAGEGDAPAGLLRDLERQRRRVVNDRDGLDERPGDVTRHRRDCGRSG
jgi:hypothetical protein